MIVHQDEGRRRELEGALDDLARVDRRVIHRAPVLYFVGDQEILAIEEEDAEFLLSGSRHRCRAIIEKRVPGTERRTSEKPRLREPQCRSFDKFQLRDS